MYRNYYFKLVKNPSIKKSKKKALLDIFTIAGMSGYKIRNDGNRRYNVINKQTRTIEHKSITYKELKEMFPLSKKGGNKVNG